ncbi:MAG: NAD(P)/FAD-dependent oxidoreductase [Spirochaetota bacterium]
MRGGSVLVVGGGLAGLAASAFLRRAGLDTTLLEKNDDCGGLARSFERKGFTYDAGPRALIDAGIMLPMLDRLGLELPTVQSRVSIGIGEEIIHVESRESLEAYGGLLARARPGSAADAASIVRRLRRVMKDMDVLYGIENPMIRPPLEHPLWLFGKLLPWSLRFLATMGRIYSASEPVEETLARMTDDPSLADLVGQHFFRATPAFFALSYFSLYLDYLYPRGGTGSLAKLLEAHVRDAGVRMATGRRAVAVDLAGGTVTDQTGEEWRWDELVWCADLKTLYGLADEKAIQGDRRRLAWRRNREAFLARPGGDSVFALYLGIARPPSRFAERSRPHLFYTPETSGLGALRIKRLEALKAEFRGLPSDGHDRWKASVLDYLAAFVRYNTLEISIPVLRDPELAPAGHTGLIVSLLLDYDLCHAVESEGWFEEFRERLESLIIDALESKLYPGIGECIVDRFSITPLSLEREIGSSGGAITGWSFEGGPPPVVHQIHRSTAAVQTPAPHVFQAGQWTYSPSGVPIALLTGKLAADAARRDLRFSLPGRKRAIKP